MVLGREQRQLQVKDGERESESDGELGRKGMAASTWSSFCSR
jgi:hypothetical protein